MTLVSMAKFLMCVVQTIATISTLNPSYPHAPTTRFPPSDALPDLIGSKVPPLLLLVSLPPLWQIEWCGLVRGLPGKEMAMKPQQKVIFYEHRVEYGEFVFNSQTHQISNELYKWKCLWSITETVGFQKDWTKTHPIKIRQLKLSLLWNICRHPCLYVLFTADVKSAKANQKVRTQNLFVTYLLKLCRNLLTFCLSSG